MSASKRSVLVIGAQFSGLFVARELRHAFFVTIVDAKEYFEYTPSILRAYAVPTSYEAVSFLYEPVVVKRMGLNFILGEVLALDGDRQQARVLLLDSGAPTTLSFDFCVICSGCNFGPLSKVGESLWFPTIHEVARKESEWGRFDERRWEERKRHILEEHAALHELNERRSKLLVCGAGFIGVELATDLRHYLSGLDITIVDFLPRCLGPLPDKAAEYCQRYLDKVGIKCFYSIKYDPTRQQFWDKILLPEKAAKTYICTGVKACNYFMPSETLSDKGPGGGGWIHFNQFMQVTRKPVAQEMLGKVWGNGRVFAVGDCNYGCIGDQGHWSKGGVPPIPKIAYPAEEQAYHACVNIKRLDSRNSGMRRTPLLETWWPWGAGMLATSLGPYDGCFVVGSNHLKGSGRVVAWWWVAALEKKLIDRTKVNECQNGLVGRALWYFVHHTPMHIWGSGPLLPCLVYES